MISSSVLNSPSSLLILILEKKKVRLPLLFHTHRITPRKRPSRISNHIQKKKEKQREYFKVRNAVLQLFFPPSRALQSVRISARIFVSFALLFKHPLQPIRRLFFSYHLNANSTFLFFDGKRITSNITKLFFVF